MTSGDSSDSLRSLLRRLWRHLRPKRRRQYVVLAGLMGVTALSEVVTLGAVLPFLGVLTNPESVWESDTVRSTAQFFGIQSPDELLLPLTVAFASAAVFAGAMRVTLLWLETRLAYSTGADISLEVYRRTLYQPYPVHVSRNTSEVIGGMIKVNGVVAGVLVPVPRFVSQVVILTAITIALLIIDPLVALGAGAGFGGSYVLISLLSRSKLRRNSERIARGQTTTVKAQQEGLGGIRDILLDGNQQWFSDMYGAADGPMRRAQGDNVFISIRPRFIMEAIGMVVVAVLAYWLSGRDGGVTTAIPVLGTLALGAQRLLPALQQMFDSWSRLAGGQASLRDTLVLLDQPMPDDEDLVEVDPLRFEESIALRGVGFRYGDHGLPVLSDIDLQVSKGARVGFVGETGSGKSTLLDVVMGLLEPTEGSVEVDGMTIAGAPRRRAWQKSLAHVPQHIFLADTTWTENIAFGVPPDRIDHHRVWEAAQRAQIAEFIESTDDGYDGVIGERGIRLSGGQRQRIGIARALYRQAQVLVLDEATSALDNTTEQAVMDAIASLERDLTVLIVAHRLTTVQGCDLIVELAGGRIIATGAYDDLLEGSPSFREMVEASG